MTASEIENAIAEQRTERERALNQANFHGGQIAALERVLEQLKARQQPKATVKAKQAKSNGKA